MDIRRKKIKTKKKMEVRSCLSKRIKPKLKEKKLFIFAKIIIDKESEEKKLDKLMNSVLFIYLFGTIDAYYKHSLYSYL